MTYITKIQIEIIKDFNLFYWTYNITTDFNNLKFYSLLLKDECIFFNDLVQYIFAVLRFPEKI